MAVERFPPKLMFWGDWQACQNYVREAKTELTRTVNLADKMGVSQYARTIIFDAERDIRFITKCHGEYTYITIEVPPPEKGDVVVLNVPKEEVSKDEELISAGIYSGFAYTHQISYDFTDGPPPLSEKQWLYRLNDFCPTIACRAAYPDDFVTNKTYQPITRLISRAAYHVQNNYLSEHNEGQIDSWRFDYQSGFIGQTNVVKPCQYSGPLARACSLALGNGNFNLFNADDREALLPEETTASFRSTVRSSGFRIEYAWQFYTNDNCVQDNLGNWWLVQINVTSRYNGGVFARPMPIITAVDFPTDPIELAAVSEFKGIPTGEGFPTSSSTIWTAIDDGDWLLLLDMDDPGMGRLYDENFFSENQSWVYNDTGTEGRICTYTYNTSGYVEVTYWNMTFSITTNAVTGAISGTATLGVVSRSVVAPGAGLNLETNSYYYSTSGHAMPQTNYQPGRNYWFTWNNFPTAPWNGGATMSEIPLTTEQPTWVGWINGQWHELSYRDVQVHSWSGGTNAFREWTMDEYTRFGPYLDKDYQGNDIPWSQPLVLEYYPKSIYWDMPAETWTVEFFERYEVVANTALASNYLFRPAKSRIEEMVSIQEITTDVQIRTRPSRDISFVTVPYNRNAYFIWDYGYNGGGGSRSGSIGSGAKHYLDFMGFSWSCGDGNYLCDVTDYPYPIVPKVYPAQTQIICPSAPAGWNEGCAVNNSLWVNLFVDGSSGETACTAYVESCPPDGTPLTQEWLCQYNHYCRWRGGGLAYTHPTTEPPEFGGICGTSPSPFDPVVFESIWSVGGQAGGLGTCADNWSTSEMEALYNLTMPGNYWHAYTDSNYYRYTAYEVCEVALVADGLPGSPYRYIGDLVLDPVYEFFVAGSAPSSSTGATSTWWCQTAVLGAKAAIYCDPREAVYDLSMWPYTYYPLIIEGTMPPMPTDVPGNLQYSDGPSVWPTNEPYRWLTFVGVNGP